MKSQHSFASKFCLALTIPGLVFSPVSFATLTLYDTAISEDHIDGAGPLPYAAALTTPAVFDGTNANIFDFGNLTGEATIEFIVEGNPVDGGRNGYLGRGTNTANSLRYEQWDDTGSLGFTRSGVADYATVVPSPTDPTHVVYRWNGVDTMEIFIDGILTDTIAGATFEMPTGEGLIGNVSDGGGEGMIGTIHRITTYDSALENDDIGKHAEAWLTTGDPGISVPVSADLGLNGLAASFEIILKNTGEANVLNITEVTVEGANADFFTIDTALPLNIDPGEEAMLEYTVDPAGENGNFEAVISISSNDALTPTAQVQVSGLIRDPELSVAESLDLGESEIEVTQMLTVENLGGTRPLNIDDLEITGTNADKFSAVAPGPIAAGASGEIEVTFTPDGSAGGFTAQLAIRSDDLGSPLTNVALSALTPVAGNFLSAYDSVIAADHGNGTGMIPYQAILSEPTVLDTTNSVPFDFGEVIGDATFEFIVQGDPDNGGQNGFLSVAENTAFSLRYEQWDDTGVVGFTHGGVVDYVFEPSAGVDGAVLNSPTTPTHLAYLWQLDSQTMTLYVDGIAAGTHIGSAFEMPSGVGTLGNNAAGTEGMLGTIHRVTIYNSDIGEDNIIRHANAFVTGAGASDFQIVSVEIDQETEQITIVWNSVPGVVYAVDSSFNLTEWDELDDSLTADDTTDSFTTSSTLPEGETKIFFRVRRP